MRVEEFEKLTEQELRLKANEAFTQPETSHNAYMSREVYYAEAKFYLDEIERRKNDNISRRDFRMELIVILLIALELLAAIGLAVWGDRRQTEDVNKQLAAFQSMQTTLSHLEESSKATAETMKTLKSSTDEMSGALQKQLALFYDVSVNVVANPNTKELTIGNNGRTNITAWGGKFGDEAPTVGNSGLIIPPQGGLTISAKLAYDYLVAHFPKPQNGSVPFELYMKNERGESFIQISDLWIQWQGDTAILKIQTSSLKPGHWKPGTVKNTIFKKAEVLPH